MAGQSDHTIASPAREADTPRPLICRLRAESARNELGPAVGVSFPSPTWWRTDAPNASTWNATAAARS